MGSSSEHSARHGVSRDDQALIRLLAEHGPGIRRRIAGMIPRQWQALLTADDVMQQSFTDAFLGFDSFVPRDDGSFPAWLYTIAERNLITGLRMLEAEKRGGGRRKVEFRSPEDSFMALYDLLNATASTPSRRLAREEACATVRWAVDTLPPAYRQVIELYDLLGKPMDEVAQALDRKPGAVHMMRHRAHQRLAEILGSASHYLSNH